jgi:toxin ParE1/3/4
VYTIHFSEPAENDLTETIQYISQVLNAPNSAKSLYDELVEKLKDISRNPTMLSFVNDEYLREKELRCFLVKNFLCFFKVNTEKQQLTVIRFLYGRRDWKNILNLNDN